MKVTNHTKQLTNEKKKKKIKRYLISELYNYPKENRAVGEGW